MMKSVWPIIFYVVDYIFIIIYSKEGLLTYINIILGILGLVGGIFLYINMKKPIANETIFGLAVIFSAIGLLNILIINLRMLGF